MLYTLINVDTKTKITEDTLAGYTVEAKYSSQGTKLRSEVHLVKGKDRFYWNCFRSSSGCVVRKDDLYAVFCESDVTLWTTRKDAVAYLKVRTNTFADMLKGWVAQDAADEKYFKAEANAMSQVAKFKNVLKQTSKKHAR